MVRFRKNLIEIRNVGVGKKDLRKYSKLNFRQYFVSGFEFNIHPKIRSYNFIRLYSDPVVSSNPDPVNHDLDLQLNGKNDTISGEEAKSWALILCGESCYVLQTGMSLKMWSSYNTVCFVKYLWGEILIKY